MADCRYALDKIWNLKVPPKVKSFLWLVSIDRIPTKEFLGKRGVKIGHSGSGCPWCEREQETLVKWRPFVDFADFFSFCNNVSYKGIVKSLWLISVSAGCWSAWLARNELMFDRRWPKMSSLVFLLKIRALMWVRAVYDELKVNEKIWWVCPIRSWSGGKKSGIRGCFWCPPCFGGVKFNVYGMESEGEVGCGGVLRNSDGVVRAVFLGPSVATESSAMEVGAVCLALEVFQEMGWMGSVL
ncbi:hypothetical protein J1N35_002681 [Gossypium stocksii]|uniref:Reverse transcriptase zinc-binding domain-containing protein n=1 Tax=Gossypium stocksii TaxID=47602 RepID=A0A9D3WMJ0_9ROSI|nr:hypothetical protein J1N35_002681 [Gossypium stocksii]